jgi:hypothetical protein
MQSLDDQCALIFIWCYVNLYASKLYISVFKIYQRLKAEGGCSWCSWWRGPEGGTMFLACSFLLLLYPISFVVYSRLPLHTSACFVCSIISALSRLRLSALCVVFGWQTVETDDGVGTNRLGVQREKVWMEGSQEVRWCTSLLKLPTM